ncbi:MAG: hypothetical protein FE046_03960 [Thermoplasmata archaeon]|nr:MAG: hypothetical protein FE046_03960 [Thermoplasmata archaeon]
MNPFLNPLFAARLITRYLTAINRAWRLTPDELKRYQDRALRKTRICIPGSPLPSEVSKGRHPPPRHSRHR